MSRFSKVAPVETEQIVKTPIDGSFLCQFCDDDVDSAFYLPEHQILTWKCSNEHISKIEKFVL